MISNIDPDTNRAGVRRTGDGAVLCLAGGPAPLRWAPGGGACARGAGLTAASIPDDALIQRANDETEPKPCFPEKLIVTALFQNRPEVAAPRSATAESSRRRESTSEEWPSFWSTTVAQT